MIVETFKLFLVVSVTANVPVEAKIDIQLLQDFAKTPEQTNDIVVTFKRKPAEIFAVFESAGRALETHEERNKLHEQMTNELKEMASVSQADVLSFLEDEAPGSESNWITNEIFIDGANKDLVDALQHFDEVETIRKQFVMHLHIARTEGPVVEEPRAKVVPNENSTVQAAPTIEWGIQRISADKVWGQGNTGKGPTVAVIDTGIRSTHECFPKGTVVAWKDAVNKKPNPYDDNGHGTHVCGTIAGNTGTGVAPATTLAVCKACNDKGSCAEGPLKTCGTWVTEQKPQLVSNSWGGGQSNNFYSDITKSWQMKNILAVFSAGNSGPDCKTGGSPGDYFGVVSVAATNDKNSVADFSSRGEGPNGINPSVSAPGQAIKSSWHTSDTAYNTISGTSMACPHVSGMSALIFASGTGLNAEAVRAAVIKSCESSGLADTKQTCGGVPSSTFPNNVYGNGIINCVQGLQSIKSS